MWNSTIEHVWNGLTQFKLLWLILKWVEEMSIWWLKMLRNFYKNDKMTFPHNLYSLKLFASNDTHFLCCLCFCVIDLQRTRCLQLSNFKTIVIALFWLAILSHSMYTYRCNKSFCIWMTIFPKGLPNLFSILKPNILTEVRLTNGVTNRSK